MMAQGRDICRYNDQEYICLKASDTGLFCPTDYGIIPCSITGCWRGYWCEYELVDDRLKLQSLHIHTGSDRYPELNGVSISAMEYVEERDLVDEFDLFDVAFRPIQGPSYGAYQIYEHIELPIPYSGKLLLARDYKLEYNDFFYGNHNAFAYNVLLSLAFENGILQEAVDHGETAKLLDEIYRNGNPFPYDALPEAIQETIWWYSRRKRRKLRDFLGE